MDLVSPALQLGFAGVAVVAEALVIIKLYNDNKSLQSQKDALQEARRLDAKEGLDKVSAPLSSISQTISLIYDKLQTSNRRRKA